MFFSFSGSVLILERNKKFSFNFHNICGNKKLENFINISSEPLSAECVQGSL